MSSHIVLGDPHVQPDTSNDRFTWVGELVIDRRPDTLICMGDFADMPSLCSYDFGKKDFEGRRFQRDIEAVHDALQKLNKPIDDYNEQCKKNKKAQYKPRKVMILGNHCERINRVVQLHPELEGTISTSSLQYKEYGWEVIQYKVPINIDGISYCHSFPSGIKGEPISGLTVASSLLAKQMTSCTVGHNHLLDWAVRHTPKGDTYFGLSAGCFFKHSLEYAINVEFMWWRGVIIKNNVHDGVYDLETVQLNELERMYR